MIKRRNAVNQNIKVYLGGGENESENHVTDC